MRVEWGYFRMIPKLASSNVVMSVTLDKPNVMAHIGWDDRHRSQQNFALHKAGAMVWKDHPAGHASVVHYTGSGAEGRP